jgi:hypothetical protein
LLVTDKREEVRRNIRVLQKEKAKQIFNLLEKSRRDKRWGENSKSVGFPFILCSFRQ